MNLDSLRGWMKGEDCVVVGCGPSAEPHRWEGPTSTPRWQDHWTIGCNRAVTFCSPDFAVCVEPRRDHEVWNIMREVSPLIVFSHIDKPHPRAVLIGSKDVRAWLGYDRSPCDGSIAEPIGPPLRLGQSPFYAAAVAILLGFETIGLIGVDLTEDRWPNPHKENEAWGRLAEVAKALGSRIVNLNPESRLETVPAGQWEEVRCK